MGFFFLLRTSSASHSAVGRHFHLNGLHIPPPGTQMRAQGWQCLSQFGGNCTVRYKQAPSAAIHPARLHQMTQSGGQQWRNGAQSLLCVAGHGGQVRQGGGAVYHLLHGLGTTPQTHLAAWHLVVAQCAQRGQGFRLRGGAARHGVIMAARVGKMAGFIFCL